MSELDPGRNERRKHIQEQVFQIPALYVRLLAAALHNPVSWRYDHHLCQYLPDRGDSILRQMHGDLVAEWLKFGSNNTKRIFASGYAGWAALRRRDGPAQARREAGQLAHPAAVPPRTRTH